MVNKKSIETLISKELIDYLDAIKFMEKRVDAIINKKKPELIWLLSHPKIYTCGITSKEQDFLKKPILPVYKTSRGGQITYHGPGQRVVYVMKNLNDKKDLRNFINILEKISIETLKEFNIESKSYKNRIGIWVTKLNDKCFEEEKKIGSIGIKIKKWITFHGISLNICPDLNYFKFINPCGIKNCQVTSLKELGVNTDLEHFDNVLIKKINQYLVI